MATKATIIKADVQIADMNRQYYQDHRLTLAQHPSETEERLMIRLLAFALHADDELSFASGLSAENEPDLWKKDLTGNVKLWIDLGQVDEKRIRKACSKADRVVIYTYQARTAKPWWQQIKEKLDRFDNLSVISIENKSETPIAALAQRNLQLQCSIQDAAVYLSSDSGSVELNLNPLK
ncbi:MAG: YaeQ family protein [Pseudomonadota bacterium]